MKPDSGEGEVPDEKPCEGYGKCTVCDEAHVEITYDLAQRILAALGGAATLTQQPDVQRSFRALAAELRQRVTR